MRRLSGCLAILVTCCTLLTPRAALADPEQTVRLADQVLHDVMAIPARQIPQSLLAEAQGIAIIPDVIKIGFVAGIRRGHGIVMVRDSEGEWSLPQFVTLTGGSVGWQAGVQGTDVVLVFMTRKGIDGLLHGKFTVGADASVAAGPVGRDASAATDVRLRAEILSYSRSRGLFLGLALDGSAIEIDADAQIAYYGSAPLQVPVRIPQSAVQLRQDVTLLAPGPKAIAASQAVPVGANRVESLRESLARHATQLNTMIDDRWQKYLAVPPEVFAAGAPPRPDALQYSLQQFDRVAQDPKYQSLWQRLEFQSTHELLREYVRQQSDASGPHLALPPPPSRN